MTVLRTGLLECQYVALVNSLLKDKLGELHQTPLLALIWHESNALGFVVSSCSLVFEWIFILISISL